MSLDLEAFKRRRTIMMIVSSLAALTALAGAAGYFRFGQRWAVLIFLGAIIVGFGSQIWFVAGLRSKSSNTGKGA